VAELTSLREAGIPVLAVEAKGARLTDADGRVVEAEQKDVTLDPCGRQPVARICTRRHDDLEAAIGVTDDFLASESVALG